ncbi:MAG: hypothetical protein Q9169_000781 [Polycauliona sp. 2 TL-2023]
MASHRPFTNGSVNDGGLPEPVPYQGLEHHAPPEQKEHHLPIHQEKEYYKPPASPEVWHGHRAAIPDAHEIDPSRYAGQSQSNGPQPADRRAWWKKKRFVIPLAILILVGAVAGGIAGGLSTRNNSSPTAEISSTQQEPDTPSTAAESPPNTMNSSLASVAWSDTDGFTYRRLYYQDDGGIIKESAWNSSTDEWYTSNDNIGVAKLQSPIAAAVAGNTTWPFQISVYFLDPQGHVYDPYTTNGKDWDIGQMTNEDIIPAPDSDLAIVWSQGDQTLCEECGQQTLLLAYQDSNDRIWVVNTTDPPEPTALEANAKRGTGLAMDSIWYQEGSPRISVYYQTVTDDLVTADWEGSEYGAQAAGFNRAWAWTLHEDTPLGSVTNGASFAAFASDAKSTSGDSLFSIALASGPRGITVTCQGSCTGVDRGTQGEAPSAMRDIQPFSAVAANVDRHVYAFQGENVKEFVLSADRSTWSLVGDVPTNI